MGGDNTERIRIPSVTVMIKLAQGEELRAAIAKETTRVTISQCDPKTEGIASSYEEFENDRTLAHYKIHKGSQLFLTVRLMIVVKTLNQNTIELEVRLSHTVEHVKTAIHAKEGIPPD